MEFKIEPKNLHEVLKFISNATESKGQPILSNVLIESLDLETLSLSVTDGSVAIVAKLSAQVETEGAICVNAKKLQGIVGTFSEEIKFKKQDNNWVKLKSGKSNFRLAGMDEAHFPGSATTENYQLEIDQTILASLVKSVVFSTTNEESRYTLQGVKIESGGDKLKVIATDGSRIAYREVEAKGDLDVLLPKKCLTLLTKLPKETVHIGETANHLFFKTENFVLSTNKMTGTFPNYTQITGIALDNLLTVNKDALKKSVERALQISDQISHSLKFTVKENELVITASEISSGEFEDSIEAVYEGDEITFAVNSMFLSDFLEILPDEIVYMNFATPNLPIKLSDGTTDYNCWVMPLRV